MNRQQLKTNLEKDYSLLVFADFAEVSHSPTAAYKLLANVRKDAFADNERIVFYGNCADAELIDHVTKARELLDIGEFFCIWQNEITDALTPGEGYRVNSDTFCPLLWGHLEVRHNGDVYPCCVSKELIGNGNDNTLTELYHSDQMNRIRGELLSGVQSAGCEKCWRHEAEGLQSNRQWHIGKNSHDFYTKWYNTVKLRSLDLKPGNVCNFKCRVCNPTSSSLVAEEVRKSQRQRGISISVVGDRWEGYNEFMWAELDKLIPDMENLDFYGGEPFLLKELRSFLHSAVDNGHAEHIRLHFNTNGSIYPVDLIDTLKEFREVDVCLSIDTVGAQFELERGGVWADVEQNILKFKALTVDPRFKVSIFPTVNIQNIYYLDRLYAWAEHHNIMVTLNYLDDPFYLSVDSMTATARALVADKYQNSSNESLRTLAQRIKSSTGSNGQHFIKTVAYYDRMRAQDFTKTHPEIAQAMGYTGTNHDN
jgi:radical SAM protein with 4Fe4S-binding SPASM domain